MPRAISALDEQIEALTGEGDRGIAQSATIPNPAQDAAATQKCQRCNSTSHKTDHCTLSDDGVRYQAALRYQETLKLSDEVKVTYEATTWSCKNCKAHSDIDYTNCNECKFPKPNTPEPNDWKCSCGLSNRVRHKECVNFMYHYPDMPLTPGTLGPSGTDGASSQGPWIAGKKNTIPVAKSPFATGLTFGSKSPLIPPTSTEGRAHTTQNIPLKAGMLGPPPQPAGPIPAANDLSWGPKPWPSQTSSSAASAPIAASPMIQKVRAELQQEDKTVITMIGVSSDAIRFKWKCGECDSINDEKALKCTSCGQTTAPQPPTKGTSKGQSAV